MTNVADTTVNVEPSTTEADIQSTSPGYIPPCGIPSSSIPFVRREDGSEDFDRLWAHYKAGFGDPAGEFWLGLDTLHSLTTSQSYGLWVDIEDYDGTQYCAKYSHFLVGDEASEYLLDVSGYDTSTNAGDSLTLNPDIISSRYSNGRGFTTRDRDNDLYGGGNCAAYAALPWWMSDCSSSGPTAVYGDLIIWYSIYGDLHSFKYMQFSLVPN